MTVATKLERKMEKALAARLRQQTALKNVRMRFNDESSAKVNLDLVIKATRGEQNPPYSGIYDMSVTVTFTAKQRKTVNTLPQFLTLCAAIEDVICLTDTYALAAQVSLCEPDFHCYEITVSGGDSTPQDGKHSSIWTLTAIAMPQTYATAIKVNPD